MGDSYCSLAWGSRLAAAADPDVAAGVLRGHDGGLTHAERALVSWARQVAGDPNTIIAVTTFLGLRIAFSTVNDASGAQPDRAFASAAPQAALDAVGYGRPIAS